MDRETLGTILWPAAGFGLGGLLAGFSGDSLLLGFGLMGMLGAAVIAYITGLSRSMIVITLSGGIGFFLGFTIPLFILLTLWEPPLKFMLTGVMGGGLGATSIAAAMRRKLRVPWLYAYGAVGFGLGMLLFDFYREPLLLGVAGFVGGAVLGFGLRQATKAKA
jgi:hypothetical protein